MYIPKEKLSFVTRVKQYFGKLPKASDDLTSSIKDLVWAHTFVYGNKKNKLVLKYLSICTKQDFDNAFDCLYKDPTNNEVLSRFGILGCLRFERLTNVPTAIYMLYIYDAKDLLYMWRDYVNKHNLSLEKGNL